VGGRQGTVPPGQAALSALLGASRLGRSSTEYRGQVGVTEDGEPYENSITRVIAPPLLLFEHAHDSVTPTLSYTREILSIEEGTVTDADVTPPAAPGDPRGS